MRRSRRAATVALAGILAATAASCSRDPGASLPTPKPAFCEAAWNYDHRVERNAKLAEQITIVAKIAHNAPKDIARDMSTFLDAMKRRADGDTTVVDNAKIKNAVENVNRRAADGCELYKQNRDGSGGI